jgi:L-ascorbate metabolism protein UlaG (beta-lactamase superfamily)
LAPAAELETVRSLGLDCERVVGVAKGDMVVLGEQLSVKVMSSAHETVMTDSKGQDYFLGFVIRAGDTVIYHSGDCVPYPGLAEELGEEKIDVAFLPVNGRDDYRRERNIAGNFTFEESLQLCRQAGIEKMVCQHFGMFAFNSVAVDELKGSGGQVLQAESVIIPEVNKRYVLTNG